MDQFVFVSHASKDKHLLRPLVQALIDAGLKVWFDTPEKLDYGSDEILRLFYRIRAGGRWEDEIDEAKRLSSCILVCWSKRAEGSDALMRHPVWFQEADYGRTERKLVSCRIDDMDPAALPANWGAQQITDASHPKQFALLTSDIRRMMQSHADRNTEARRARRPHRILYLVDRMTQDEAVTQALEDLQANGGVRPFFIVGPENELVDEFLQRLAETNRSSSHEARRWEQVDIDWPRGEEPARFAHTVARLVCRKLAGSTMASPATDLANLLHRRGRPVAIISRLASSEWTHEEGPRLRAWLNLWREVGCTPGHRCVMPILRVKLGPARPGWKQVPGGKRLFDGHAGRNRRIWKTLQEAEREFQDLAVTTPPILAPLLRSDVDTWQSRHFELGETTHTAIGHKVGNLLKPRRHQKHGVPHQDFFNALKPLFSNGT